MLYSGGALDVALPDIFFKPFGEADMETSTLWWVDSGSDALLEVVGTG